MFRKFAILRRPKIIDDVHRLVSFNGEIVTADSVQLSPLSAAALYGKGVFTTVGIYDQILEEWLEHWRRLSNDAPKVGVDISSYDLGETGKAIVELARRNGVHEARARITFFDAGPTELWHSDLKNETQVLITTADFVPTPKYFRLTVSPFTINSTSPLTGVKSCNYLEKILAKNEARSRGFHECIQLNERGEVVSASMANVFWVKDGKYFTPSLKTGCVRGTKRFSVLESQECLEVEADISELRAADEIFLTSAGIDYALVTEFDGRLVMNPDSDVPTFFIRI